MATLFLIIIYLTFISLGLPDSLFGAAWPAMRIQFGLPFSYAGYLSVVISGCTIISSLCSGWILRRFKTGPVTLVSVVMTAVALMGFSLSNSFGWLFLLALPLGLGAGTIDSALNNYVATHYQARHMNWLHCCWGIGATVGPLIMGACIARTGRWQAGYLTISLIQCGIALLLALTLRLWKQVGQRNLHESELSQQVRMDAQPVSIVPALLAFFCYCTIESTTGLWGATYLASMRGLSAADAAFWVSMFFLGITVGRFLSGFLTFRFSNNQLITFGIGICAIGIVLMAIKSAVWTAMAGLMLIGLGLAPMFPAMLQETPRRFGLEKAQQAMGFQMAAAYCGASFMPPVFGVLAQQTSLGLLPLWQASALVGLAVCFAITTHSMARRAK